MADEDLVEQLERFRDEQRTVRAERRAGRSRQTAGGGLANGSGPATGTGSGVVDPASEPRRYRDPVAAEPAPLAPDAPNDGHPVGGLADRREPDGGAAGPDGDDESPAGPRWLDRARTGVRGLGQTLITFGVVILLFVAYELWITDLFNRQQQGQLQNQLAQDWNRGEDPAVEEPGAKVRNIPLGQSIALIRIPSLGLDYVRAVVEGTGEASLAEGPGHYVNSVLPGQVGNFAVAGHRVGKGSPFLDLDRLRAGDAIVIETQRYYYVYRVLGNRRTGNPGVPDQDGIPGREIVSPTDVAVVAPVPDHPGATPHRRLLTLTTCHPRFSARQRMIIHAEEDGRPWPKSSGLPPVLKG